MRKRSRNASAAAAAGSFTDRADDVSHGYGRPSGCAMRGSAPSAAMVVMVVAIGCGMNRGEQHFTGTSIFFTSIHDDDFDDLGASTACDILLGVAKYGNFVDKITP